MLTITGTSETKISNSFPVFEKISSIDHEEVLFCYDKETGLKAIIAIHSLVLGPALGGTRMWNYKTEEDALTDVLRLSRGMTYKAAITGLDLGGGKAVIIGNSRKDKTPEMMQRYGRFINTLNGNYITAEDVGTSPKDMIEIKKETKYVTGVPEGMGGSGDPSPITAYGTYMGMKAAVKEVYGKDSLNGKSVAVQGVGHVGQSLVELLCKENAKVYVCDINEDNLKAVTSKHNVKVVSPEAVYDLDVDIYSPCALGSTINTETLNKLRCTIIAGAANNQLANEEIHGKMIMEKGIVYAPDFLINAGGLVNVASEILNYSRKKIMKITENIYKTTYQIFQKSKEKNISTSSAAIELAQKRINVARKSKKD